MKSADKTGEIKGSRFTEKGYLAAYFISNVCIMYHNRVVISRVALVIKPQSTLNPIQQNHN